MRQDKINHVLQFLHRSKALETAERYGASMSAERNSVADHSWRLALMALVIGQECNVQINMERALALCLTHDLAEAKTGDIDAYEQIQQGKKLIDAKAVTEEAVMHEMTDDLSFGDWIYNLTREYELQETLESKFVKALDKIEGFLHIAEVGFEHYVPKEFHSTYADKAVTAFDEVTGHFPELSDFLDTVKAKLKEQCEKAGVAWVD